jgi:hypothetical protein
LPRRNAAPEEPPTPVRDNLATQLAADLEALRERESNLRDYEVRLRAWQTQLDAASTQQPAAPAGSVAPFLRPSSNTPFAGDATLEAAWAKFHRARSLFEAEQHQMRDDRIALRALETSLKEREADLARREAQLAAQQQQLAEFMAGAQDKKVLSAMQRLTQAPFLAAKAAFKSSK